MKEFSSGGFEDCKAFFVAVSRFYWGVFFGSTLDEIVDKEGVSDVFPTGMAPCRYTERGS